MIHGLDVRNLKGDVFGGLTAAVVALPLALAFGVASGAGPVAGVYGAIFVGLFAALFGGTPAQVSGPTGPMTVVMAAVFVQFADNPAIAFTVVMLAGLLQIGFGVARIGQYISLMPFPVISGFMSGIGIIIIFLQLAPLIGHATPPGGVVVIAAALPDLVQRPVVDALAAGLMALAIVFLTPGRIARMAPSPLIALGVGTLVALLWLPGAPVLGDIPSGWPKFQIPAIDIHLISEIVGAALVLALLGSIDSLLTSLIADNLTQTTHNANRELIGQGIGNLVAGLFGAIPGAGATMRTVVNIRAGGATPISGALHALVLLAIMLGLGPLASHIPHAVLAGILIKVGIDIIDWDYLRRARRAPRAGLLFMLVVLALTVLVDLITAVAVGVVLASLLFVKRMADLQLANIREITGGSNDGSDSAVTLDAGERELFDALGDRVVLYQMAGPFTFGAAKHMATRLAKLHHHEVLILDLTDVPLVDSSASMALEDAIMQGRKGGDPVYLVGIAGRVRVTLDRIGVLALVPPERQFATRAEALRAAAVELGMGTAEPE